MPTEQSSDLKFEIGHVLFIDIVGYSKLLIEEQKERIGELTSIVLGTAQVRESTDEQLVRLPTGDGMALVFRHSAEEPARCALEIAEALRKHPEIPVRMGIHSGPVSEVTDVSGRSNLAGAGINMAQRVMDCGDAGHILLSQHVADDLVQYRQWAPRLRDLGECEVKHGMRLRLVNLYAEPLGNPDPPEKFRQVAASAPMPSPVFKAGRIRWHEVVVVAVLLAVLIGAGVFFFRQRITSSAPASSAAPAVTGNSIAVLPFENLSEEKGNAYFAEGIQDEILTRLAKVGALKVISRTSTVKYQSAPDNLREVGRQLGVANVLEGSVQKIANAVHINVQLIRAATDEHVWAESYDRKLDDVFGVEGEVASAIADQLNAKLTGAEEKAITDKPTQNTAAYDAYLRGLSADNNGVFNSAYEEAASAYFDAVQLDPKFALAWARLAVARSFLFFNGVDIKTNSPTAVKEAADRAIGLQPELGEAWIAQGAYRYRVREDFADALHTYNEAKKRLPNSSFVLQNIAYVERRLGLWSEAEAHFKKAAELDPRNVAMFVEVGIELFNDLRRFDDAQAALDRALKISPGNEIAIAGKATIFRSQGRLEQAAKQLALIPPDSADDEVVLARMLQAEYERRFDAAIALIEQKVNSLRPGESLNWISQLFVVHLGYCQEWAARPEQARADFLHAIRALTPSSDSPRPAGTSSSLAMAYAGLGDKANALDQARHAATEVANDAATKPGVEVLLAQIQARFGDFDSAIAALPHLLEVPAGLDPADLRNDPLWDPLRKDPRFQKLCEQSASQNPK